MDGAAANVPPDEGCEVLKGKVTDEKWDKNDNKNAADSDGTHILIKLGVIIKGVKNFKKCNMTPLKLSTREYRGNS